jgi:hypothetical protein
MMTLMIQLLLKLLRSIHIIIIIIIIITEALRVRELVSRYVSLSRYLKLPVLILARKIRIRSTGRGLSKRAMSFRVEV